MENIYHTDRAAQENPAFLSWEPVSIGNAKSVKMDMDRSQEEFFLNFLLVMQVCMQTATARMTNISKPIDHHNVKLHPFIPISPYIRYY